MDWFRSWHGAPTDTKWLVIARRANVAPGMVSAIVWALFDYASQAPDRGNVTGFDVEMYAVYSGFPEADIAAVLAAMRDKEIINDSGRLSSWEKRQPKREDDSTERVARYREKQRSVTQGNAPDTDTDTEQNRTEEGGRQDKHSPAQPTTPLTIDLANLPPSLMQLYRDASGEMGQITPTFRGWFNQVTTRYTREQCERVFRQLSADIAAGKTNGSKWQHTVSLFKSLYETPTKANGIAAPGRSDYDPGTPEELAEARRAIDEHNARLKELEAAG